MKRHQGEIFRYLRYLGADPAGAEDIAQETFLAAYTSPTFPMDQNPGHEAGWLRGTARNLLYQTYRKKSRARELAGDLAAMEEADRLWTDHFLRDGDGDDYISALRKCVDTLPERQRAALDMRYDKNFSRNDMATTLRISAEGVKALMRRIRSALKNCIEIRIGLHEEAGQ